MTWTGDCVNGRADGFGKRVWRYLKKGNWTESIYTGMMRDGKYNGYGVADWYAGKYIGEWKDGKQLRGLLAWNSGSTYEGEYKGYNKHGRGVWVSANGARYEGDWRNNKPNGNGTYTSAQGQDFSGHWTNGCFKQGERWATFFTSAKACGFK